MATITTPSNSVQPSKQSVTSHQPSLMVSPDQLWRISVDQYHAMIEAGILTDDDTVELIEGWLVTKMPKKPLHRAVTHLVRRLLVDIVTEGWYLDSQEPITILDSELEPDVIVVQGDTLDYLDRHPGADEIALLIEISDATLQRDQTIKKRLYASANIPVYWIINLIEYQIEVYTDPSGPTQQPDYRQRQTYGLDGQVPVVIDGQQVAQIAAQALLPDREG